MALTPVFFGYYRDTLAEVEAIGATLPAITFIFPAFYANFWVISLWIHEPIENQVPQEVSMAYLDTMITHAVPREQWTSYPQLVNGLRYTFPGGVTIVWEDIPLQRGSNFYILE